MAGDVGGAWFVNRYPGCGVDTPNHAYSFSFGPRFLWPRYFSRREEVLAYLRQVVEALGLRRHIRLSTQLMGATWDEEAQQWVARLRGPDAPVLHLLGDGPQRPELEGLAERAWRRARGTESGAGLRRHRR